MKMTVDGKDVLLLKNPFPKPYYKSKDGFGMSSHMEKLRREIMIVILFERSGGVLIADWPETVPAEIRSKTILPSDLSQVHIYEDGWVVDSCN
jgi:hypothetical protein